MEQASCKAKWVHDQIRQIYSAKTRYKMHSTGDWHFDLTWHYNGVDLNVTVAGRDMMERDKEIIWEYVQRCINRSIMKNYVLR